MKGIIMAKNKNNGPIENLPEDEEMYVSITLDDGKDVKCSIVTIFECEGKDYIALLPLDENGENNDGEVWLYGYKEDESNPDAEPELIYIGDDEEYEKVSDAFDEYLDTVEFDELVDEVLLVDRQATEVQITLDILTGKITVTGILHRLL